MGPEIIYAFIAAPAVILCIAINLLMHVGNKSKKDVSGLD